MARVTGSESRVLAEWYQWRIEMKPYVPMALALAVALVPAPGVKAEGKTAWIHVRVEEPGKESKVSVNIPLPVAEAALALAPETVASGGCIHLGSKGRKLSLVDLRRAWKELRATGDAEIVSVEDRDQTVKIDRLGDKVRIHVEGRAKAESINVEIPTAAVDALLSGEGETFNLRGALAEIRNLRGDIVRVDDRDSKVRIWIDEGI
jgi:hypothetical protein